MVKERFDIVILKELFFFKSIQMFLEILRTPQFGKAAHKLGGYNTKDSGKIIYAN